MPPCVWIRFVKTTLSVQDTMRVRLCLIKYFYVVVNWKQCLKKVLDRYLREYPIMIIFNKN